jgi:hypothetical protein
VSVEADRDWKVRLIDEMEKQSCMDVPESTVLKPIGIRRLDDGRDGDTIMHGRTRAE